MTDVWVCSNCHSVNRQRSSSCYGCGASQSQATGQGQAVRVTRAFEARAARQPYRSALLLFVIASGLIVAVGALGLLVFYVSLGDVPILHRLVDELVSTGRAVGETALPATESVEGISTIRFVLLLAGIIAFAAWLALNVANVPSLGGGTPSRSPARAFVLTLIPLVNLWKVPGIVQDVLYRLDPRSGGFPMILVAWFGLVGSAIIRFVLEWWAAGTFITGAARVGSIEEARPLLHQYVDTLVAIEAFTAIATTVGAALLVMIMARIERRSRVRDREIRAAFAAAEQGVDLEDALSGRADVRSTPDHAPTEPAQRPSVAQPSPPGTATQAQQLTTQPLVGMPPVRALGLTDAGTALGSRDAPADQETGPREDA